MRKRLKWFGGAVVMMMLTGLGIRPAAAVVVGPGNCNESGLIAALAAADTPAGGTITFNCGTATINFTSGKQIAKKVTIDGGGTITFDGGNAHGFFQFFGSSQVTLKRLTFQRGIRSSGVRALENFGDLTMDTVRVINNNSTQGPVVNYGTLFVMRSTFSSNSATSGTLGDGGAIQNDNGTLLIRNSTFNGNTAAHQGGAVFSNQTMHILNSTFNGNTGTNGGGAIYQESGGDSSLTYSTIVGNSAPFGAGVYNDGGGSSHGTLKIAGSIISGNSTGNCDGVLQTGGFNLSNGTGCGGVFTGDGDLINQTLTMGALSNNGGPTFTMMPAPGNPAINHIPSNRCFKVPDDQRGGQRPYGSGCDSGSVEVGAPFDVIFADGFE